MVRNFARALEWVPGVRLHSGSFVKFDGELDGHFPVFNNPTTHSQFVEFLRSLAYDDDGVIPAP